MALERLDNLESANITQQIPSDFATILPSLRVILSSASSSYGLKNEGVQVASADIFAILDADCVPNPDWPRHSWTPCRTIRMWSLSVEEPCMPGAT